MVLPVYGSIVYLVIVIFLLSSLIAGIVLLVKTIPSTRPSGRMYENFATEHSDDALTLDKATDDATKPDKAKPDTAKPDEAKPDEAKPDEAKPDEAKPDTAKPDKVKPDTKKIDKVAAEKAAAEKKKQSSIRKEKTKTLIELKEKIEESLDDIHDRESDTCSVFKTIEDSYIQDKMAPRR